MTKPLDESTSLAIATQIKSKPKARFQNAYKAAVALKDALYVQGFLVFVGKPHKPVEHSWLETEDHIIDPNFPFLNRKAEELHYFPAQRLSVKQLKAAIEEAKEDYPDDEPLPIYGDPPYEYYGDSMLGGQDYQAAYQSANEKCKELNRK